MQTAGTNILILGIDITGQLSQMVNSIICKLQLNTLSRKQCLILLDKSISRLGQNALEISLFQRLKLYPDRKTALKLRNKIRWLRHMEGTGCNKENMIRLYRSVLGHNGRSFYDRQDITLNALPGNIMAAMITGYCHLINFIQEYNTAIFSGLDRCLGYFLHVNQLHCFLLLEKLSSLLNSNLALTALLWHKIAKHILNIVSHSFKAGASKHAHHRLGIILYINFQYLLLNLTRAEALSGPFPASIILLRFFSCWSFRLIIFIVSTAKELTKRISHFLLRLWHHNVQNTFLCCFGSLFLNTIQTVSTNHTDSSLGKIADYRFNIPANITDLGKLSSLNLDKRGLHQLSQTAGNFSLAHTSRTDHQYIFRNNVILHAVIIQLTAAPAVSKRNCHSLFCLLLPNYILIQLLNYLSRSLLIRQH